MIDFHAVFMSTGIVTLAEMGDKTQLLAFLLATRFKKPSPIILGILCATIINHALAGAIGTWVTSLFAPEVLRWVLGISFLGMAIWTLIPDKLDEDDQQLKTGSGVFLTTTIAFFLAEMGDKTQIATVALAAHYGAPVSVVVGTTLGMMIADAPAVFLGNAFAAKLPLKIIHSVAAALFALIGIFILLKGENFVN